jgi:hypothetical protein
MVHTFAQLGILLHSISYSPVTVRFIGRRSFVLFSFKAMIARNQVRWTGEVPR